MIRRVLCIHVHLRLTGCVENAAQGKLKLSLVGLWHRTRYGWANGNYGFRRSYPIGWAGRWYLRMSME